MKADAAAVRAALDRPSPDTRFILLHGPDMSSAQMLAARLGRAMGSDAERVDLDGAALRNDPARLADEAATLSLFGTRRFIRVDPAGEESGDALEALLAASAAIHPVVVLAPGVKASGRIVKLALGTRQALAHACYEPSAAEAERLATAAARDHGLRLAPGIAARLVASSGGDQAVMMREIEKLALYCDASPDRPADLDDAAMDAVGADLGDSEASRLVSAVIDGRDRDVGEELARLGIAGGSPVIWLRQLARRLLTLAEMRADMDRGEAAGVVMKRHRVFWREEAATGQALQRWSAEMLAEAIGRVRAAERGVMSSANAGSVLAEQAALGMARAVARRR